MAKILIIDDDDAILDVLRRLLSQQGHKVLAATGGVEGVEIYRKHPIDLVITDIVMPEQDGIETLLLLKRENPDVKIIVISGGGKIDGQSYLEVAGNFGVESTICKPFRTSELIAAVENACN
jgi:CheY-like chemotaxis protein